MTIKLTFAQVEQAAADIRTAMSSMDTQLADLTRALEPIRASWDSDARSEYDLRQAEWNSAATQIRDLLERFSGAVTRSGTTMSETEAANLSQFRL